MRLRAPVLVAFLLASCAIGGHDEDAARERSDPEVAALRDADPATRLHAATAIRDRPTRDAAAVDALVDALTDPERPELGALAADALGRTPDAGPRAYAALVAALASDDWTEAAFAARALGRIAAPSAEAAVAAARASDAMGVRCRSAARASRRQGTPAVVGLAGTTWSSGSGPDILGAGSEDWLTFRETAGVRYLHRLRYSTEGAHADAESRESHLAVETVTWDADGAVVRLASRRATWAVVGPDLLLPALVPVGDREWRFVDERPDDESLWPESGDFMYRFDKALAPGAAGACRVVGRPQKFEAFEGTATYRVDPQGALSTLVVGDADVAGSRRPVPDAFFFREPFVAGSRGYSAMRRDDPSDRTGGLADEAVASLVAGPHGIRVAAALLDGASPLATATAISRLERSGAGAAPALDALLARHKEHHDGEHALVAIGRPAVDRLATLAGDPDPATRSFARWTLREMRAFGVDVSSAAAPVAASLERADFDEVDVTLQTLGDFGAEAADAVPALAAWVDERRTLFGAAVRTLARIGPAAKAALPALERMSHDPIEVRARMAREAIEAIRAAPK